MRQWFSVVLVVSAFVLNVRFGFGEPLKVSRQVLLADGTPAAQAKVLIRTLNTVDGTLKQNVQVQADRQGRFDVEMDVDSDKGTYDARKVAGYIMVDVPGAALTFESFQEWRHRNPADVGPLRLTEGYAVEGRVVSNQGVAVADAQIAVQSFASEWFPLRLNYPNALIATPALTGKSTADGTFSLRAIAVNHQTFGNGDAPVRINISATATLNGETWMGGTEMSPPRAGLGTLPKPAAAPVVTLYPTLSVVGRVLNGVTSEPVAGAMVKLVGTPDTLVGIWPAASKDETGTFRFPNVPAVAHLVVEASHASLAEGWARVGEASLAVYSRKATRTQTYDNVTIKLRPWATVAGHLIEAETGKPPPPEHILKSQLFFIYGHAYKDTYVDVGRGQVVAQVQPDGSFTARTASGATGIMLSSSLYAAVERPLDIEVPVTGIRDLQLLVKKWPCFYVRVEAADPARLKSAELYERDLASQTPGAMVWRLQHGPWTRTTRKWGDKVEIRVVNAGNQGGQELLPWTEITADPKNLPLVIRLP